MTTLRHRIGSVIRQTPSPSPVARNRIGDDSEEVQLVPVSKLKGLTTKRKSRRRSGLIFGLGSLVGIVVALFFANKQEVIKFDGLMDFNLDSFLDAIPVGIVKEAKDLTVRSFSMCSSCSQLTTAVESRA